MDNGQDTRRTNDMFKEGLTAGVGVMPDDGVTTFPDDNLNSSTFMSPRSFGRIGNQALSAPEANRPNSSSFQDDTDQTLGRIVDIPTPPLKDPLTKQNSFVSQQEPNTDSIDPTIAKHLADGKVNHDDVGYLKNKTEELVNDPAKLAEFIMAARHTITDKNLGDSKWLLLYLFLYFLQQ